MGWSGGIFTRVHDWTEDEAGGYDILSTRMDEEDDNFETGINACLTKDGTNTPTSNLPMGGYRHTGVSTGQAYDQYATAGQVQNSSLTWPLTGITGGSLNAYTLTLSMAPSAYAAGQTFSFKANRSNSGATTLNVNSLGAKNVYYNGAACAGGEIVINRVYTVVYDGTQFHLMGGGSGSGASYGGARLYMTSQQNIDNYHTNKIWFIGVSYDDSSYSTGNASLRIPVTGRYRITTGVRGTLGVGSDCRIDGFIYINSSWMRPATDTRFNSAMLGPNSVCLHPVFEGDLTANDIVEVYVNVVSLTSNEYLAIEGSATAFEQSWLAIERIK